MKKLFFLIAALFVLIPFSGARAQAKVKQKLNVGILIFNGVQIIDYTGPYEVLGSWSRRTVFMVAETPDVVTTNMGMKVVPNYTFEEHPQIDILIIPGGGNILTGANGRGVGAQLDNQKLIKWIQDNAKEAKYVMSVCNGAFFLAKAGLLDNLEVTTTAGYIKELQSFSPSIKPVYDKRFTDNGKIMTTGGLSSGIDGALHLVEILDGKGWAKTVANGIEYNWQPESDYARATEADTKFPDSVFEPFLAIGEPLDIKGGKDNWEEKWLVTTSVSAAEMMENINRKWSSESNWSKLKSDRSESAWKFTDKDGKVWKSRTKVEPSATETGKLIVTVKIMRA